MLLLELQSAVLPTPLTEIHRKAGAQLGAWFGCVLPDHFGDWQAEYRFACESVALMDKNYRAHFEFTGPDRVRFLNAILTNNIKDLIDNHGTVSLFLNPQGHIQAELETYAFADKISAVSFAMIRNRLIEDFEKYIIMDDVSLTDRSADYAAVALEGPDTPVVVAALCGFELDDLDKLETREASVRALPCRIIKRSPGGAAGADFVVERALLEPLWDTLLDAARKQGGGPGGYAALNTLRLEQGVPWFGYDFGDKQIPHEAGLQDSHISYTKGCYTGQEIVERVRSRGQVNRLRVGLKFDGPEPPQANTQLLSEGKEIGYVTRTGFSPTVNTFIGMGYVRREKSAAGTLLDLTGGTATVIALPIATHR
jgi:folate-binding protein YgfZ